MMFTCRSRSDFVANSHPSNICPAHAVAYTISRTTVLLVALYSAEGAGGGYTDLGSCCRGSMVHCYQRVDHGNIFICGTRRSGSIYVVGSVVEIEF